MKTNDADQKRSFVEAHSPPHSPRLFINPSFLSPSFQVPSSKFQPLAFPLHYFPPPSKPTNQEPTMKLSVSNFLSNLTSSKKHKPKKSRSISRHEGHSFDSTTSSYSDESISTPKSVLRSSYNDFKISKDELENMLRCLCPEPLTDEEVSAIVAAGDGRGCISMADLGKICESDGEEELKEAFKVFDANDDGKISAEELLKVFVAMGEACTIDDCKRMIGNVDSDGDGLVCFEDFAKMMECHNFVKV
ncbi:hypothetical protein LUZ63_012435 [Rhynchospora breviuscula]|uniref:EF-hand domain-containing protein n=1 Tax=Rhynchospora breviuscula TaxID=2022672 RepID=A0A9Q0CL99_9POAL|nr:hypothetical protein LUZ63_012435 [Rhynchospora breviuscula]